MTELQGKVMLITGGSSGIGRASALAAAQAGAVVAVADLSEEAGEETARMICEAGGEAFFLRADVTDRGSVAAMIGAVLERYGRLDCAVNNAGVSGGMHSRLHEYDDETFDLVVNVNLRGVWLCMKAELMVMMQQGGGVILNMASVAGLIGAPKAAAYAASKHGVIGLTRSAAGEYAKYNIRINAICPSFTETPMVTDLTSRDPVMDRITQAASPMKRLGRPEEIAAAVVWLASDAASFVHGHALALDGGLTAL